MLALIRNLGSPLYCNGEVVLGIREFSAAARSHSSRRRATWGARKMDRQTDVIGGSARVHVREKRSILVQMIA